MENNYPIPQYPSESPPQEPEEEVEPRQQLAFRYLDPYQPDNQRTVMDHLSQEAQAVAAEEVLPKVEEHQATQ